MKEIFEFLKELAANNNREWFHANKARYDRVRLRVNALAERLIAEVAAVDPRAAMLSVADCTYRIYRDTRFSPDKTPYKTHIGIFINPPLGKKALTMGHYLHLEPGNSFMAAGTIGLPSPMLRAVRNAIRDGIEEYVGIVESPEFRRCFPTVGDDFLKTAPKGFDRDWEYVDYVRPRNFVAHSQRLDIEDADIDALPAMLRPWFEQGQRFNAFHNFTLESF